MPRPDSHAIFREGNLSVANSSLGAGLDALSALRAGIPSSAAQRHPPPHVTTRYATPVEETLSVERIPTAFQARTDRIQAPACVWHLERFWVRVLQAMVRWIRVNQRIGVSCQRIAPLAMPLCPVICGGVVAVALQHARPADAGGPHRHHLLHDQTRPTAAPLPDPSPPTCFPMSAHRLDGRSTGRVWGGLLVSGS